MSITAALEKSKQFRDGTLSITASAQRRFDDHQSQRLGLHPSPRGRPRPGWSSSSAESVRASGSGRLLHTAADTISARLSDVAAANASPDHSWRNESWSSRASVVPLRQRNLVDTTVIDSTPTTQAMFEKSKSAYLFQFHCEPPQPAAAHGRREWQLAHEEEEAPKLRSQAARDREWATTLAWSTVTPTGSFQDPAELARSYSAGVKQAHLRTAAMAQHTALATLQAQYSSREHDHAAEIKQLHDAHRASMQQQREAFSAQNTRDRHIAEAEASVMP